jgi:predicted transcriptional regulator
MDSPERNLLRKLLRRTELLDRVREEVAEKRDLTERLDVSRATVDRAVRELEALDVLEWTDEGYALTLFGELVNAELRRLLDRFETLGRARELLLLLPRDFEIDPAVLDGAEVVLAERPMPHEPLDRLGELIERHDRVRCYAPVAFPSTIETLHRRVTETDAEVELSLDDRLLERLRTSYGARLEGMLAAENATLHRIPSDRGLGVVLALFDDRIAWIGVHDDGDVRGSITLGSDRASEWARERLDRCRETGEELPPDEQ